MKGSFRSAMKQFQPPQLLRNLVLGLASLTPICVPASATIAIVSISPTNTQAVFHYSVSSGGVCTIAVSESPILRPLVNDVDPRKFSQANIDRRNPALNSGSGADRWLVVGKRSAERGIDGVRYSRALQANTQHYYNIACQGENSSLSGSFQTANLAMGATYSDPQPVDRLKAGEYAWPELTDSDRAQALIDPQTGVQIRRVSLPKDRAITQNMQNFAMVRTTGWSNALGAIGSGGSASVGSDAGATLELMPQNNGYAGYISFFKAAHGNNSYSLNWMQVTLNAGSSDPACSGTGAESCRVVMCLTADGVSCFPGSAKIEQQLTPASTTYTVGSQVSLSSWQSPGYRVPNGTEIATRNGLVTCDGSTTVAYAGGDVFGEQWAEGSTITIGGVDLTVSRVVNTRRLQLRGPCTSTRGQATQYQSTNFGVLIRRKAAGAGVVWVSNAKVSYQMGVIPAWTYSGAYDLCSATPVQGANGHRGYNCSLQNSGTIYWIDDVTGEAHLIARNFNPYAQGCGTNDSIIFDSTNPDIFYCGGPIPQAVHYFGNHLEPQNTINPGGFEESENLPRCNSAVGPTNQPCLVYGSLTGSVTLGSLVARFDSEFQSDRFLYPFLVGVENGLIVFRYWRGANNSIGWTVLFDPQATSNREPGNAGCLGAGTPGCVVAAMPSWSRPNARWCPQKANDPMYIPGWMAVGPYIWGGVSDTSPGKGPYVSTVVDGTALQTGTGIVGGIGPCPANALGITGSHCTSVKIDGERAIRLLASLLCKRAGAP